MAVVPSGTDSFAEGYNLNKGGFTQNPVAAYEPAYGQRQSSHMQQEHHQRQPRQSGVLKTILSKPEAVQN